MSFPSSVDTVTLTCGPVLDADGNPRAGVKLYAIPAHHVFIAETKLRPGILSAATGADGTASLEVIATDSAGLADITGATVTSFRYRIGLDDISTASSEREVYLPKAFSTVAYEDLVANTSATTPGVLSSTFVRLPGIPPGSHAVIVGDSWTDGATKWPTTFATLTGLTVHNYGETGAGWVQTGAAGGTFGSRITAAIADTSYDHDAVSLVIISGGINDITNNKTLSTCLTAADAGFAALKAEYTRARIVWISLNQMQTVLQSEAQVSYVAGMAKSAADAGLESISDMSRIFAGRYSEFNSDGIHPTTAGYVFVAKWIHARLRGIELVETAVEQVTFDGGDPKASGDIVATLSHGTLTIAFRLTTTATITNGAELVSSMPRLARIYTSNYRAFFVDLNGTLGRRVAFYNNAILCAINGDITSGYYVRGHITLPYLGAATALTYQ